MYIKNISLKNYRNIEDMYLELSDGVNIICGNNAQGKTNILESIYMSSTGRSHRSYAADKDIINFSQAEAHVRLNLSSEHNHNDKIDIHFQKNKKKQMYINGIRVERLIELCGIISVIFFGPQDLQLIKAGPNERRRFIDIELCQLEKMYYYSITSYNRILKQRNSLLKTLQTNNKQMDILNLYDEMLAKEGIEVIKYRRSFLKELSKTANRYNISITNGEELCLEYKCDIAPKDYLKVLQKNHERDIMNGTTTRGVHRDDFVFKINNTNARSFASQGQQRTACLCVKLAEIQLFKDSSYSPILLLDDVFSELDEQRQLCLIKALSNVQTIITCTGVEDYVKNLGLDSKIFYIKNGKTL